MEEGINLSGNIHHTPLKILDSKIFPEKGGCQLISITYQSQDLLEVNKIQIEPMLRGIL